MNLPLAPTMPTSALDEERFEIVNGQIRELEPTGVYECGIATVLSALLLHFVNASKLGKVATDTLFNLLPGIQRRPDVAFVFRDRWPIGRRYPKTSAWDIVPDLAVEVVSPTSRLDQIVEKMREYFQAGVRQV